MKKTTPAEIIEIPIFEGRVLKARRVLMLNSYLKLDPNNPRLQSTLIAANNGKLPTLSQEELRKFVWEQFDAQALTNSIRESGGIKDPILCRPDGTVVDGNCRLVALTELAKENPKFQSTIVHVLPKETTENDVLTLLVRTHGDGAPKSWSALDQDKTMAKLIEPVGTLTVRQYCLANSAKEKTVWATLKALKLLAIYQKETGDYRVNVWAYLKKYVSQNVIRKFRKIRAEQGLPCLVSYEKTFETWLFHEISKGHIQDNRYVGYAAMIYCDPEKKDLLEKGYDPRNFVETEARRSAEKPFDTRAVVHQLMSRLEKHTPFLPNNPLDGPEVHQLLALESLLKTKIPDAFRKGKCFQEAIREPQTAQLKSDKSFKGSLDFIGQLKTNEQIERGLRFAQDYFSGTPIDTLEKKWKIGDGSAKGNTAKHIILKVLRRMRDPNFTQGFAEIGQFPAQIKKIVEAIAKGDDQAIMRLCSHFNVNPRYLNALKNRYYKLAELESELESITR